MNIIHYLLWDLKCAHVPDTDTVYRIISVQTGIDRRHILAALAGGGGGGVVMTSKYLVGCVLNTSQCGQLLLRSATVTTFLTGDVQPKERCL